MNGNVGFVEGPSAAVLVRIGGLGDLLVAVPAMALLRRTLIAVLRRPPGGRSSPFKLICRPEYGILLRETRLVDELIPAEDPALAGLFAGEAPDARARETIGPADLVVGWVQNPRSPLAAADWGNLEAREARFFAPNPESGKPLNRDFFDQTARFLAEWRRRADDGQADKVSHPNVNNIMRLNLTETHIRAGLEHFGLDPSMRGRFAVIHPGSGSRNKRWALGNFLEIARALGDYGRPGIIVTGEAESDLEPVLREIRLPSGWRWRGGPPPLLRLAGMLAGAGLYLGNDSGVTHLAGAAGAPSLALFKREWLPAWRPAGPVRILAAESPADIPVGRVRAEIERLGLLPA